MCSLRSDGWDSLDAESLEDLEEKEFENFCFDLISFEAYDRHLEPKLNGPSAAGKDGGRDVLLDVTGAPLESRSEYQRRYKLRPVTHDHLGRTAYSCKTGDAWLDLALKDARHRGARAIEVLLEGGRFVLLVNAIARLDERYTRDKVERTPHEHLAAALWERMKAVDPAATDPGERVEILDANVLASYLRARRPEDGDLARWMERFRLRPVLHGLDEWRELHREEREDLQFVDEDRRSAVLDAILAFARERPDDASRRVGWLLGPPGVGKTRLVLEALRRDPAVAQCVRVAFNGDEASARLTDALDRYSAVLLVVDDCPAEVARDLARTFRVRTRGRSACHLLVMTPAALSERDRADISIRWEVDRLGDETARRIVRNALRDPIGLPAATIERIVRLAEGFPWFLALLSRESEAEGRPPHDMREAVDWALASRWEATGQALHDLRRDRMRAMLATLLTRSIDWRTLTVPQQEALARAVGLARWDDVVATANGCVLRGVLRRRLHFQYVTPQVLAREIVTTLFDPGGGDDPHGRRLVEHGGEFLEAFFDELGRLDVRADLARSLSAAVLTRIVGLGHDWGALRFGDLLVAPLRFVAEHLPTDTARALRHAIEATSVEELHALAEVRRPVTSVLAELARRRHAFEDAEAALFRLALTENEACANNATATWALLFAPVLHMTHQSGEQRAELLETRLASSDPAERRVALKGARAMLAIESSRAAAWALLLERLKDDDGSVVADVVEVVCAELLPAMGDGYGDYILPRLTASVSSLGERQRRALGELIQRIRTLGADDAITATAAFRELALALAPTTFPQRLRQHVGTWAADLDESTEALDDEVARQGLSDAAELVAELDWLFSPDAVRAASFARALGRCDAEARFLGELRVRCLRDDATVGAREFLARYFAGLHDSGRQGLVDAELLALRGSPLGGLLLAQVTVLTAATPERLAAISAAIREGRERDDVLRTIGHHGRWLREIDDEGVRAFLETLLVYDGAESAAAVLRIVRDRISCDEPRVALFRTEVMRALERSVMESVPSGAEHAWAVCATAMINLGEVGPVAECTVRALGRPSGTLRDAWRVLRHARSRDMNATWEAVARGIDRRDPTGGHLLLAFRFHREAFVWPTDRVLAWVGRDARRARAAVQIVKPDDGDLPALLRALVERFGAEGTVADEALTVLESTNGVVVSLAGHDRVRLDSARRWADGGSPQVRAFALRLVDSLTRRSELHAAEEDEERRRWGT